MLNPPLELAEHRSPPGRFREHCLSIAIDSGNASCAAPRVGRGAQGTALLLRGERWGVLSFGYFSLHKQRKVTQGAGAERPPLAVKARAEARHLKHTNTLKPDNADNKTHYADLCASPALRYDTHHMVHRRGHIQTAIAENNQGGRRRCGNLAGWCRRRG